MSMKISTLQFMCLLIWQIKWTLAAEIMQSRIMFNKREQQQNYSKNQANKFHVNEEIALPLHCVSTSQHEITTISAGL